MGGAGDHQHRGFEGQAHSGTRTMVTFAAVAREAARKSTTGGTTADLDALFGDGPLPLEPSSS